MTETASSQFPQNTLDSVILILYFGFVLYFELRLFVLLSLGVQCHDVTIADGFSIALSAASTSVSQTVAEHIIEIWVVVNLLDRCFPIVFHPPEANLFVRLDDVATA